MEKAHEDQGPKLTVINTVFIALATFAVIGRLCARRLRHLILGPDDWIICFSLACNWALYGIFAGCRQNGLGKHIDAVSSANVAKIAELLYVFQIFYALGPTSVKLSLLFLYRRVFERSNFLHLVYAMMALIFVFGIIVTFMAIFNCTPISAFWTRQGNCFNFASFALGYAVVNIVTDLTIWFMPIPIIWKIQMPKQQKVALSLIFALGLFDCGAAVARLFLSMLVLKTRDITWYYAPGFMWSVIEVSTGIVCTCLPTMRVVLEAVLRSRIARKLGLSSGHDSAQRYSDTTWPGSIGYNEAGDPRRRKGPNHIDRNFLELQDPEWDAYSQRGIMLYQEVNVELPPLRMQVSSRTI
ncbi:hypothetical protein BO94DRAFT_563712 [Aspergillus sclerotioniger CBS 115572]|uniref:Rhodopsin domain-containing protein n=1 Tax=Aspergillus sclerotioniger CBS 115572 TaxID=1450535 RepID=A0A317X6R5_9EURO|nr:hypothetical protein BO94DRAFT_563712 [Aspergillus sclerotioniger CBS 115572]PWY94259.1 hypothetical protein BO94DRAFT_563712 [Aspergillus sclerotioniger CBS 115572]